MHSLNDAILRDIKGSGIIVGGPPCEPWSSLNLTRRRMFHPKYSCMKSYFRIINKVQPALFVFENVPGIKKDPNFHKAIQRIGENDYDIEGRIIKYSDYGAALSKRRLFVIGIKRELNYSAADLFSKIRKGKPVNVKRRIFDLKDKERDPSIEHIWPLARTVNRYREYYNTGKYGWYILRWDAPAPSFGNVTKTYTLHPGSFNGGKTRPISVLEALRIIGFPNYHFPPKFSMKIKYEMISDSVPTAFSTKLAKAIKKEVFSQNN